MLWELGFTYKGLNSFECLPGFKGSTKGYSPRLGLKIQEDPKGVPSQHDENFKFQEFYQMEGTENKVPSIL
jgi:hypothetical protein